MLVLLKLTATKADITLTSSALLTSAELSFSEQCRHKEIYLITFESFSNQTSLFIPARDTCTKWLQVTAATVTEMPTYPRT